MMKDLMSGSYLFGGNAAYIDELYEAYLQGDETISPEWKRYFDQIQVLPGPRDVPHEPVRELIARIARERGAGRPQIAPAELAQLGRKQAAVFQLISSYRFLGVRHANLDPLKRLEKPHVPELEPAFHDLADDDLERVFDTGTLVGPRQAPLRDIIQALKETYCGTIGLEYMYITDTTQKRWLQERFEGPRSRPSYGPDYKRHILERLTAAEILEKYLHTRYVGQKRFSLEGGDTPDPDARPPDAARGRAGCAGDS
jgi:2-oxoglutarate dehydrogenase E1 component